MRILIVVAALIATPFVMSVAQKGVPSAPKPKAQVQDAAVPNADVPACKDHPEGNAYGWEHGQHDCGPVLGGWLTVATGGIAAAFLGHAITQRQNMSEDTAKLIDEEIRRLPERYREPLLLQVELALDSKPAA